jgi:ADP-ribosylglycohydrolase
VSPDIEHVRGALLGLAVGDALGAPLEGLPPEATTAAIAGRPEMTGGRGWAPGESTDDTALMLALAESIAAHGLLDTDDVGRRYISWAANDGKGMGHTTRMALIGATDAADARLRAREHWLVSEYAAGNGTVMRATPIGVAARTAAEAAQWALRDAELTHADPAAAVASGALCVALLAVRTGEDPLEAARGQASGHPRTAGALALVAAGDVQGLARLAAGAEPGACWTTLAIGLHALVSGGDYERAIGWVLERGGDTDTNAAVAGALVGYRDGVDAIPARWLEPLRERRRIEQVADKIAIGQPRPRVY